MAYFNIENCKFRSLNLKFDSLIPFSRLWILFAIILILIKINYMTIIVHAFKKIYYFKKIIIVKTKLLFLLFFIRI